MGDKKSEELGAPKPGGYRDRDVRHAVHPFTNLHQHLDGEPLIIERGEGCYIYDQAGKKYLEGFAALWCANLGFSEPRLVEAAKRQMETLPYYHTFTGRAHRPGIDLASKLVELKPSSSQEKPLTKVFFANSGSSANDTAIKIVRLYNNARGKKDKKNIISRQRGYHGVGIGSGSMSYFPHMHASFDLPMEGIYHTDCPDYYRHHLDGESEEEFSSRMAENLEKLILELGGEKTCAAFVAEPVMGVGGVIIPPKTYFEKIQAMLDKYDMLFIADEVVCGFGRTGQMFGSQTLGLSPDIMVLAKGLSAAYLPIAATLMTEQIFETVAKEVAEVGVFGHGFTYSGHPVSCAVALEAIQIVEDRNLVTHTQKMHKVLMKRLENLKKHPMVGEVRGIGLMAAVEVMKDKESRTYFDQPGIVGKHLFERTLQHGVILRAMVDAIGFSPPLIIEEDQVHAMVDGFETGLEETYAWAKQEGHL